MKENEHQLRWTGNRLRHHRQMMGLTLREVGERIGTGRAAISNAESGQNISLSRLIRICDALETTPSEILECMPPTKGIEARATLKELEAWLRRCKLSGKLLHRIASDREFATWHMRLAARRPDLEGRILSYLREYAEVAARSR